MDEDVNSKKKYKLAIFFEDDSTKNLLLKLAKKGAMKRWRSSIRDCVVTTHPGCMCIKSKGALI